MISDITSSKSSATRELFVQAAKAAGYNVECHPGLSVEDDDWFFLIDGSRVWNPLDDDGDALRLAVRTDLTVMIGIVRDKYGRIWIATEKQAPTDEAATRLAILLAASAPAPGEEKLLSTSH